jgi:hypothetical protein
VEPESIIEVFPGGQKVFDFEQPGSDWDGFFPAIVEMAARFRFSPRPGNCIIRTLNVCFREQLEGLNIVVIL